MKNNKKGASKDNGNSVENLFPDKKIELGNSKKPDIKIPKEDDDEPISIVCIGGSAGSVQALEKFFKNLPPNNGMGIIVIQHLDPTHKSLMPELIANWTELKVNEVENGMKVRPNHIYVIPSNKEMSIINGSLMLFEPSRPRGFRMPIDIFMESLAKDQGEKAVAVILSGLDSDGVKGAGFIKENFGMVMVQSPETSQYDSMPVQTIQKDLVDYISAPEKIPGKLIEFVKNPIKLNLPKEEIGASEKYKSALEKIYVLLRNQTGHDFSLYKINTIHRRIERRMNNQQIPDIQKYVAFLQKNPDEIELLFKELLIGVTKFFRDPEAFQLLKQDIIPRIIANKNKGDYLRIWCAGVSTGEEIYSVAIVLLEYLEETSYKKQLNIQLFATDLDAVAIEKARAGVFLPNIITDVSMERLERFFIKEGENYHIKKEVRELIIFANHNVVKDAPFTKLDLLCCRNLLIYLSPELQKKVIPLFHYALNPNGFLFLGPSESLSGFQDLFNYEDQKWKIFRRKEGDSYKLMDFPFYFSANELKNKLTKIERNNPVIKKPQFSDVVNQLLLDKFAPPAVLINTNGDIFYFHGRTGKYLEPAAGNAQMNIIQMAREGLKFDLSSAIFKASAQKIENKTVGIRIKTDTGIQYINLTVFYLNYPEAYKGMLLVTFEDIEIDMVSKEEEFLPAVGKAGKKDQLISHLEKELEYTKQQLQTTLEEMESSFEEIKSANEELQSTNEELQSINEESISAKEEMQSLNEELMAINVDYQTKTDELTQANYDMKNLLDSTEIATIFVDNKLNLKRYTPEATKIFSIIATDLGRPLAHVVNNLKYNNLLKDAADVLDRLTTKELQVEVENGNWYNLRLFPYRTLSNYIDGLVITFSDITKLKVLEEQLHETLLFSDSIINSVRDPLVILDDKFKVLSVSKTFTNIFEINSKHMHGEFLHVLNEGLLNLPQLQNSLKKVLAEDKEFNDIIIEKEFPIVGHKKLLFNARPLMGNQKKKKMILLVIEDISNK